ncbi:Epoxide hydrolase 4 [Gossypium arboreum]|uniref:Epoxide hydrolase 4 n=1 Tax=Gossypium arboreum TaxID=29729 RepID=A0A0B0NCB4_GOSAR|nr:Epoxide hydrolase 4 [Gossypium arboreum]
MSLLKIYKFFLHGVLKLAGISPRKIDIEPGTVVKIWVPTQTTTKPAVVFLHGFAFDGILTWRFQALALANHYSVYVPDFVFFGDSITDKSERSVQLQAECIAKGLKKLGVQKCTLVGFSYGGMVGFKMAEIYPELGICKYRREKVELLKALVISDEEFTVPSYHQRIHVLWGKNDKIFEVENAHYLQQQLGEKASVEYIENSGHIVQLERPFKYNSCLNKILPSLSSS